MPIKDLTGMRFGMWTVIRFHDVKNETARWLCKCDCGITKKPVYGSQLRNGSSTGCGCRRLAKSRARVPHNFVDLSGKRFGKLVVLHRNGTADGTRATWRCRCDCGGESVVRTIDLNKGKAVTCGCSHGEHHGLANHDLYHTWHNMIARCTNPDAPGFEDYGGRGITVCDQWCGESGLQHFISDMAPRPAGHEIDRRDNDGPYSPTNCRWSTRPQQCRNTRRNRMLTHNGETMCLADWAERVGISACALRHRIVNLKWSVSDAIETPLRRQPVLS